EGPMGRMDATAGERSCCPRPVRRVGVRHVAAPILRWLLVVGVRAVAKSARSAGGGFVSQNGGRRESQTEAYGQSTRAGSKSMGRAVTMLGMGLVAVSGWVSTGATGAGAANQPTSGAKTFAKRVNIGGGRSMYIECRGSGSPTVLLLSGTDTASDLWHAADQKPPKVYPEV